jgi:hypothetical protein
MTQNIAFTARPHIAAASVDFVSRTMGIFLGRITQQRAAVAATDLMERILTSVTESAQSVPLIIVEPRVPPDDDLPVYDVSLPVDIDAVEESPDESPPDPYLSYVVFMRECVYLDE